MSVEFDPTEIGRQFADELIESMDCEAVEEFVAALAQARSALLEVLDAVDPVQVVAENKQQDQQRRTQIRLTFEEEGNGDDSDDDYFDDLLTKRQITP